MFECNFCTKETFDCSFCNYYKIQSNNKGSIKQENPKECDLFVFEASQRWRASKPIVHRETQLIETLLTSCNLITYVAGNIPDPQMSTELESIVEQLKRLILPSKKELISSPSLQDDTVETCEQQEEQEDHRGNSRGPFTCDLCPYSTFREDLLQKHGDGHKTGKLRFQCPTCPYAFGLRCRLREHLRRHTGDVRFSCSSCSFTTAYSESLKTHQLRHIGERPYGCQYCKKRFFTSTHLLEHERRHRGEKRHKCSSCEERFVTRKELRGHERKRHLGKQGEKS